MSNDEYQHQNSFKTDKELPLGIGLEGILKGCEVSTYTPLELKDLPLAMQNIAEFIDNLDKCKRREQKL